MAIDKKQKMVIITGPTAVGKTSSSISLAQEFGTEIISADTVAVYRGMDIGAAKPSKAERDAVPHYMIDVADPDEPFDAAIFAKQAENVAQSLNDKGQIPLVVGGGGFYIKALTHGLFEQGRSDPELRASLRKQAKEIGSTAMHERLAEVDPQAAQRIHPNDEYRVVRALEVCTLTNQPVSTQQAAHGFSNSNYDVLIFCLHRERQDLYERINSRVDIMLSQGLEEEVHGLIAGGYGPSLKSMQSIGYRHMCQYISGALNHEEAVSTMKRDTRRLAKRQMTWFRAYPEVIWLLPGQLDIMREAVARFLK